MQTYDNDELLLIVFVLQGRLQQKHFTVEEYGKLRYNIHSLCY